MGNIKHLKKIEKLTWFIFVMIFSILSITQISCSHKPSNDAYTYPIKLGMPAWKILGSLEAIFNACQIPKSTLQKMSTTGLVETVLNYPLLFNYRAYNDPQQGFDVLVANFNGLQELFSRKDAGTELLARYRIIDPLAFKDDLTDVEKVSYGWNISNIEMLLSQEPILTNLTKIQCQELVKEAMTKYGENIELQNFVGTGAFTNDVTLDEILAQAQRYLSAK
jgi:hypothetical protein